jgi:hypothetical protein
MLTCSQASSPSSTAPARHPRQIAASFTLDQAVPHDQPGQVSLRFICMNVIGEHARHAVHAGIRRERSWTPRARPYYPTRPVTTGNVSRQSPDAYQDQQRTASVFLCATLPRTQTNSPDSRPRCRSTATQSVPTPSARKRGSTVAVEQRADIRICREVCDRCLRARGCWFRHALNCDFVDRRGCGRAAEGLRRRGHR